MSVKAHKVTPESVIRAMDLHKADGLIKDWRHNANAPWPKGGTQRPFYLFVDLVGGGDIELRNLREATVFVAGLASARNALMAATEERVAAPPRMLAADQKTVLPRFRLDAVIYAPDREAAQRRLDDARPWLDAAVLRPEAS
jgi:hypothetical protein